MSKFKTFSIIAKIWDSKQIERYDEVTDIPISYSGLLQLIPDLEITYPEVFSESP